MKALNICNTSLCAQTVIITEMLQFDLFLTATPLLHLVFHCLVALIDGSNQYLYEVFCICVPLADAVLLKQYTTV